MLNSSSGIAGQDAINTFNALSNNPTANSLAFNFLRDNWNNLNQL